jgi:FkbM family methyltransferase
VSVELKSRIETAAENLGYIKPKLGKPDGLSLLGDQISILGNSALTIFDVGTHVGDTTKEYLEHFPSAKVFGFEADKPNFAAAERFLKQSTRPKLLRSAPPRYKLFNVAIGERDATATFHQSIRSAAHSLLPIGANDYMGEDVHEVGTSTVQMRSLDSVASDHGLSSIDILKMDIQGGELGALKGAADLLSRRAIKLIALEVLFTPLYHGQPQFWDIGRFLDNFGYSFFRIYDQQHHARNHNTVCFADVIFLSPEMTRL